MSTTPHSTTSVPQHPALAPGDELVHTTPDDPRAKPVLDGLVREYDERYRDLFPGSAADEVYRYPVEHFSAPEGTFLLLLRDGEAISAGAFMRLDPSTIELKRIWTRSDHRGEGLARVIVAELEAEAARRGAERIVLSTGPRQPEAVRLYLRLGYTPQFDVDADPATVGIHYFEKAVTA